MALSPAQRGQILARLINKAVQGQINGDQFITDLVVALGTNFDAALVAEGRAFLSELNAAKASTDAQALDLANKIADLQGKV